MNINDMDNNTFSNLKNAYDAGSLLRELRERKALIDAYHQYGYLDRDNAIKKIQDLRIKDAEVAAATSAKLAVSSIPFEQAPSQSIIAELEMQAEILAAKLLKMSVNN
jgi:hypothetical protein